VQNKVNVKEYSAIILSAGESSRMGVPKFSLQFDENIIFLQKIVKEFTDFGCYEIIVVINEIGNKYLKENELFLPENVKIVVNEHPEWHRFYSLKIGVNALSETNNCFVHNVDNPFVNHDVLKALFNNINTADYISPEFAGKGGHPFLLSEKVLKKIAQTEEDQKHLKEFLNQYSRLRIKIEDEKVLTNINTLEDYSRYFK
jgi:CTP:molybdopterin cytidylyltransferase MocA